MRLSFNIAIAGVLLGHAVPALADVTISSAPTANMSCSAGVCSPTANEAVLNAGDLETLLASGNVEVTTTGSGVQANNLNVQTPLGWSSTNTLALDAYQSIAVSKSVVVTGSGGLTLTTNDGGGNGTLSFGPRGNVAFQSLSSTLIINGTPYALENSVAGLASAAMANPNGAYALAGNYDAAQDGTYTNCPIFTEFDGKLEGLGNTISNLSINTKGGHVKHRSASFIDTVGKTGVVENLRLTTINYATVALAGLTAYNFGYLFGDEVTGSIKSRGAPVGGLAGANTGTIISSSARVNISVSCCKNGSEVAGGLVVNNEGTIELSHANGNVSSPYPGGGLAVYNEGLITKSYATGSVWYGAGLVGYVGGSGSISNSYSTGKVENSSSAGFVYYVGVGTTGTITSSYSIGAVASGDGGFICSQAASILSNDYWDVSTSGTKFSACGNSNVPRATGLTTKQLRPGLPAGFDPQIWAEDPKINDGLPYLINNPPEKK